MLSGQSMLCILPGQVLICVLGVVGAMLITGLGVVKEYEERREELDQLASLHLASEKI